MAWSKDSFPYLTPNIEKLNSWARGSGEAYNFARIQVVRQYQLEIGKLSRRIVRYRSNITPEKREIIRELNREIRRIKKAIDSILETS